MSEPGSWKALISQEELLRLRKIEADHIKCSERPSSSYAITKPGGGGGLCVNENESSDKSVCGNESESAIIPKVILDTVQPQVQEKVNETINNAVLLGNVWKKYHPAAKKLIRHLNSSDKISWNQHGILELPNGSPLIGKCN